MEIAKYINYQSKISELTRRFDYFGQLSGGFVNPALDRGWDNCGNGVVSQQLLVAFFGKTGYGKSSTVNALLGRDVMKTSDVEACTKVCNSANYELSPGNFLSMCDFPGIGENEYKDSEYVAMYGRFMRHTTLIIYVVRADARDYSIDQAAFATLARAGLDEKRVIFAINCCDKIEPIARGNSGIPTAEQMINVTKKIFEIRKLFSHSSAIVPYSATSGWNVDSLAKEIVNRIIELRELSGLAVDEVSIAQRAPREFVD